MTDTPKLSNDELTHWLWAKYHRHGEIEDGSAAERIKEQADEIERLKDYIASVPDGVYVRNRELLLEVDEQKARIEKLKAVVEAARQWADGIGNDSKCYDDVCKALAALEESTNDSP